MWKHHPSESIKFLNQVAASDWKLRAISSDARSFAKRAQLDESYTDGESSDEEDEPNNLDMGHSH